MASIKAGRKSSDDDQVKVASKLKEANLSAGLFDLGFTASRKWLACLKVVVGLEREEG